jgi:8-oxo-dGTP pyrophosphatase MutT (NUDIX family)
MTTEEPIHVVTCFLMRGTRILILRRSQEVKTHKGLWAGVSGYIEPGEEPLDTALKELGEEVTARPNQVNLVREAEPLVFRDEPTDTLWAVHPFLFDDLGVSVRTDWEHVEHRWIDPLELGEYDTVPKLRETLEAALDKRVLKKGGAAGTGGT